MSEEFDKAELVPLFQSGDMVEVTLETEHVYNAVVSRVRDKCGELSVTLRVCFKVFDNVLCHPVD